MLTATIVLAATAFAAGATGAWSPCGFSIVDTLGRAGSRVTLAGACGAFAAGALAGGVATFGTLSVLGAAVSGGGGRLVAVVAAVALAAAVAEARGVRIVPQIRRQVPEQWRRRLPLPVAAGAYGVLLGLGFATFVLTLAFWVLAAAAFALGSPSVGVAVGIAFGLGRALPVITLAPLAERRTGFAVTEAMAMRPGLLRGFRLANAVALGACAAALAGASANAAATVLARGAVDPSAAGGAIAWEERGRGMLFLGAPREPAAAHHLGPLAAPLPGSDPAVGGELLAWRERRLVRVVRIEDLSPVAELDVPGVDALAVNDEWLAYRARRGGRDVIAVRALAGGAERVVATAGGLGALGRPSLAGDRLVFHSATPRVSRIVLVELPGGEPRAVRTSLRAQLTHPSLLGRELLYVRQSALAQTLLLGPIDRLRDRVLHRSGPVALRDAGYERGHSHVTRTPRPRRATAQFWTTALSARAAFLTLLPLDGDGARAHIVRIDR